MADKQISFGRLVFGRAITDTAQFLGYRTRDFILGGVALVLGIACAYFFVGRVDTVKEIALIAAFTLAPGGLILFAVFAWHLWLAPATLAYEASRAIPSQVSLQTRQEPALPQKQSVNWEIWKHGQQYTIYEFAAILARSDPASGQITNEASAFVSLLIEGVKVRNLRPAKVEWGLDGEVGGLTGIARSDALAWAKQRDFSVENVA